MAVAEPLRVARSTPPPSEQHPLPRPTSSLSTRVIVAGVILALECMAYSRLPNQWISAYLPVAALIVFVAILFLFAREQLKAAHLNDVPIRPRFALLHGLAIALIVAEDLSFNRYLQPHTISGYIAQATWAATVLLLVLSLAATLFPLRRLLQALRGGSWLFAALITILTMASRFLLRLLWDNQGLPLNYILQRSTFTGVKDILRLFHQNIVSIPEHNILGTSHFMVTIAGPCSGIEGLALIAVFTIGWLIFTRHELRLARAILLVPIALSISWLLNIARIAALIEIGNAGHAHLALNGFHSEAGWILFNAIALAFLLAAEHLPWLRRNPLRLNPPHSTVPSSPPSPHLFERNLAAPYLVPFLAVLATSLLTRALSSGFEALYPLRLVVALLALWWYRDDYRRLLQSQWRFSWLGPLAGAAVFLLWIALARLSGVSATPSALATQLANLPTLQRTIWITLRVLSAVVSVPIIEELAFRGYIARRVQSADVDSIPFSHLSILAILISSVAFGALHGRLWIAGILSGILFALVAKFRNRLGEAIAAHATANLLLTVWILTRSDYSLW